MMTYHAPPGQLHSTFDSSTNTSMTSLVQSTPAYSPIASPVPPIQPAYELIPHRIFVGGFPTATTETELRTFFEKYGHIREAKVIRSVEGSSKGYGFVTFDTEDEAQDVRKMPVEKLEFKGRRLNLGPAMRRVTHNARFTEFAVASPYVTYQQSQPLPYYQTAFHPHSPATYVLVPSAPNTQTPSFIYSPISPSPLPFPQQQQQQPPQHQQLIPQQMVAGMVDNRQFIHAQQQQIAHAPQKASFVADQSSETVEELPGGGMCVVNNNGGSSALTPNNSMAAYFNNNGNNQNSHDLSTPVTHRVAQSRPQRRFQAPGQTFVNMGTTQQPQQQSVQHVPMPTYPSADMTHYSQMSHQTIQQAAATY